MKIPGTATPVTGRSRFFYVVATYALVHVIWLIPLYLDFFAHPFEPHPLYQSALYRPILALLVAPAAMTIAVLVLHRAPGNVNGLLLLLGVGLIMGGTLRADSPLAAYNSVLNTGWTGLWLLGLYFPDGRAAFPRAERWIQALSALFILAVVVWGFAQPGFPDLSVPAGAITAPNPLVVPALQAVKQFVDTAETLLLAAVFVLILPSIIVRYRAGNERRRQQIRWLGWAFSVMLLYGLPLFALGILQRDPSTLDPIEKALLFGFTIYAYLFAFIAVGIAILRHKLYDIDIIIRRTVTYGILTALLTGVYLGGVVALQQGFVALNGQQSELAIIVSTLAIAALFVPLRNGIQKEIDRRFFRRKYNAEKALASFAAVVRDETTVGYLTEHLLDAVDKTIQPEHMTLWVKPDDQVTAKPAAVVSGGVLH